MPEKSFYEFMDQFTHAYAQGDHHSMLELALEQEKHPGHHASMIQAFKASALCLTGQSQAALHTFREALQAGHWYHEGALKHDADFALLCESPEFAPVLEECASRRARASAELEQSCKMRWIEPAGNPPPWPVLIALHGNSSNYRECEETWGRAAQFGWLVAIPQSSQQSWCSDHFVWDDLEKAGKDIARQYEGLKQDLPIDSHRVVIGGFSMGGTIAFRTGLAPDFELHALISLEGWLDENDSLPESPARFPPVKKAYLIAGQKMPAFYQVALKMAAVLSDRNIPATILETANEFHRYPDDFETLLLEILKAI